MSEDEAKQGPERQPAGRAPNTHTDPAINPEVDPEAGPEVDPDVDREWGGGGDAVAGADVLRSPSTPETLLDIELEATLRFGSREMTLGEVLNLGPGDVIELDRQVNDAVDLLVGDKIVARGVAVLCNGKYGIRVTEVAELKPTLESVRCLF